MSLTPRTPIRRPLFTRNRWNTLASKLAFERIASDSPRGNGGSAIAARALLLATTWATVIVALRVLLRVEGKHPTWTAHAIDQAVGGLPVFGTIFAGAYIALYSRFSSQWSYLAGMYNQIKAAEVRGIPGDAHSQEALAQWKAGFIEDAEGLHLARKPAFASVIRAWAKDVKVYEAYAELTPGGAARLMSLLDEVDEVVIDSHAFHLAKARPPRPRLLKSSRERTA